MVYYIFMNSNQTQIYRGMRRIHRQGKALILFLGNFHASKSLVKAGRQDRHFLPPSLQFRFGSSIRKESILWIWGCLETPYRLRMGYTYSCLTQRHLFKTYRGFLFAPHALKYWRKTKSIFSSELKKHSSLPVSRSPLSEIIVYITGLHN